MGHTHSGHCEGHGHSHAHPPPANFNVAFLVAVVLNLGFTVVEAIYAYLSHSASLLADAGHNLGDVAGLVMAWGASLLLARAATEKYSYGYKKMTLLAALGNAVLLVVACSVIIYESINKLIYPVMVSEVVVIVIALIGMAINGSTALLFLRGRERDLNIKAAYLHLASDALISVSVAVTGTIVLFTRWWWLDPVVGILIVLVILRSAWSLLRASIDLILGAVPRGVNHQAVRTYLCELKGVTAVHDLHIWALSTQENALTAHLVMPEHTLADTDYSEINHVLEHRFKINHVTLQVEKGLVENPCGQAEVC